MKNDRVGLNPFPYSETLVNAFADKIAFNLTSAIVDRGAATLMVSGGSTPLALFEALSHKNVQWEKVRIGLCDERWVPTDHEDSNEKLVKTHLLINKAEAATFVGLYQEGLEAEAAEEKCSEIVETWLMPFDVVILGMGNDAHTASLFPLNPKLPLGLSLKNPRHCIAITPTTAPHERMSLTRSAILGAAHLYLHFEGSQKRDVFEKALVCEDVLEMPIASMLHQDKTDIEVYYT